MLMQTDMTAVKDVSKLIIDAVPVVASAENWFTVSHPYTNTHMTAITENGKMRIGDLTQPEDYKLWREQLIKMIDDAEDVYRILVFLNKPYLLTWFSFVESYLNAEDYNECLRYCYTTEEFPNQDANVTQEQLIDYFKKTDPVALLESDDAETWANLPEQFVIYRGVNRGKAEGLSWTTDLDKAKWFASRFSSYQGQVYFAWINKSDVLMYTNERGEHEIIADPSKLNISVFKDVESL